MKESLKIIHEILTEIKGAGMDAAVCGGFPRDFLNRRIPKDIDLFVFNSNEDTILSCTTIVGNILRTGVDKIIPNYGGLRDDVLSLAKFPQTLRSPIPTDAIFMRSCLKNTLKNFDNSFSQIAIVLEDNNLVVYKSKSYIESDDSGVVQVFEGIPTRQAHLDRVVSKNSCKIVTTEVKEIELIKAETINIIEV